MPTHSKVSPNSFVSALSEDIPDNDCRLFELLRMATGSGLHSDSVNRDFAYALLRALSYKDGSVILRTEIEIPYGICLTQTQMALIPIIQADVSAPNLETAEAQLIAAAIAVYSNNNSFGRALGLDKVDSITIPCIVMCKTRLVFFLFGYGGRILEL